MVRPSDETAMCLLERFAELGVRNGMELRLCAESLDASRLGIVPARCIDGELVERLTGTGPRGIGISDRIAGVRPVWYRRL